MLELLGILFLISAFISAIILPWVNMVNINRQRRELDELKDKLRGIEIEKTRRHAQPTVEKYVERKSYVPQSPPEPSIPEPSIPEPIQETPELKAKVASPEIKPEIKPEIYQQTHQPVEIYTREDDSNDENVTEHQDWFSKLAIWIGGIALLMAGFFMVKYSIESGLLTPLVRIWLTTGFGVALCAAGFVISIKSAMSANQRIGQALTGAGIACLYFATYASVHLYGFISSGHGFILMVIVTLLAVLLSLKNGAPIAMMGLVGGFLTPWLMSSGTNDTIMLFSYLFLLFCGAQFLCIRRGWWTLLLGSLIAVYLWSAVIIIRYLAGSLENLDGTFAFVLGISFINALWSFTGQKNPENTHDPKAYYLIYTIRIATWSGALIQGLILSLISGFAAVDMALFSILSIAALVMAVLKEEEFLWAAWMALGVLAISILGNQEMVLWKWLFIPVGLITLFFIVGHWRGLSGERSTNWRRLSTIAALMLVPLLYLNREVVIQTTAAPHESFWLWMAAIYAMFLALAGENHLRKNSDLNLAGGYNGYAVFLLAFGIWTYIPAEYIPHAAGVLLILSAWYWKLRNLGNSDHAVTILSIIWGAFMIRFALDTVTYFFGQSSNFSPGQDGLTIVSWLIGICGLSSVLICFRGTWSSESLKLTSGILGLVGFIALIATYQWLDLQYLPNQWSETYCEGGLTTLLALIALASTFLIPKLASCNWVSIVAAYLTITRVIFLHLADTGAEGESFFMNALLLQFGIPTVAAWTMAYLSGEMSLEQRRRVYQLAGMMLGFVWVTFLVQDYFGGSRILEGSISTTQIYTYSVVWLILAVVYQAIGLWRNQSAIHFGSLILLLITIGKVFLVDASELEGLYRVLSFLGLGLALIGIGFFYNKVVFARQHRPSADKRDS